MMDVLHGQNSRHRRIIKEEPLREVGEAVKQA
jgi:hypothetical protein